MTRTIKTVAFDLGGVLTFQDFSLLTEEELFLFRTYMNRKNVQNTELVEYARQKMPEIYLKMYQLNRRAVSTLEMLKEMDIRISIWTNNIDAINNWFEEIGFYRYIKREDIINSFFIGFDKPDLEFYRQAFIILKCIPQSILFLDDNLQNIQSAERCGVNVRLYESHEDLEVIVESEIKKRGI